MLPGNFSAAVLRRVRKIINDLLVQVRRLGAGQEASPVLRTNNAAFGTLRHTSKSVFPQALVAPYTVLGATDAHTYAHLCPQAIYRFSPLLMDQKAIDSRHGTSERPRTARRNMRTPFGFMRCSFGTCSSRSANFVVRVRWRAVVRVRK